MASTGVVKAGYWHCDSAFPVSDIKSSLFTHLFAAFADVDSSTFVVTFPTLYKPQFESFTHTVQIGNPEVKTLLSIGGGASGVASTLASMASKQVTRKIFINSSIGQARDNNFHGLCLSWLYPTTTSEMTNLESLLKEWRAAVVEEAKKNSKLPLLLTAEVFHSSAIGSAKYPSPETISSTLDWINVLAFNFYSPGSSPTETAPPAALRKGPKEILGVERSIKSWTDAGLQAEKIALCLSFVGWAWTLTDPSQHDLFAPAAGPALSVDGSVTFARVKQFETDKKATPKYDNTYCTNYCYADVTWIGYDDLVSIISKVTYAHKEKELLGYSAWHVGADDNWSLSQKAFDTWDKFAN